MEIIITKNNVYQYAMALTARAATAGDAFTQTTITEDNFPMLEVYMSEAVPLVEGELRKKLSQSNCVDMILEGDTILIKIKEQKNADKSVYNLIESGIRLFFAYYIASRWLQTTPASSLAEVYGTTAVTHMKTATDALIQKDKTIVPESEYSKRKRDNVMMRPGMQAIKGEIITLRSEECCRQQEAAITKCGEHLISNQ